MKKIILISGASKGIGLSIAKIFLEKKNYFLILNSRNKNNNINEIIKKYDNVFYISGDIRNTRTIKKIIKFLKKKDVKINTLVCNVGGGTYSANGQEIVKEFRNAFDINFFSSINLIYNIKKFIVKYGKIICISSIASKNICSSPIAYSTSKSALNSFIISFAKNFKKNKICISGILPGHTIHKTSVWQNKIKKNPIYVKQLLKDHMPTSKFIEARDIADLAYFLSNHDTSAFNGSLIDVEGGLNTK